MKEATIAMYSQQPGNVLRVRWVQVRDVTSGLHREPDESEVLALIEALQRYAATRATDG